MKSRALRSLLVSSGLTAAGLLATAFLVACATSAAPKKNPPADDPNDPGASEYLPDDPVETPLPAEINNNSGAFGPAERPANKNDGGTPDDPDAGPQAPCGDTPALGNLAIVELMISSRSGSGDVGEWAEVKNVTACTLKIKGVSVESPRGTAASNVATVTTDIELAPGASFLVADTADTAKNNGLTGTVITWDDSDVLKNAGDTVIVKLGDVVIDKIDYPDLSTLSPGRSFAFPSDCPLADRQDWRRWSLTFNQYAPGFKGTPNAPNADVGCF
jgi:hypothetical protein